MDNLNKIEELLKSLGYNIKKYSNYFTCNALYRNGDDVGSVGVYSDNVKDFVISKTWSHRDFIRLVTNCKNDIELQEYLLKNNIIINNEKQEIKIKQPRIFDNSILNEFLPIYSYWNSRGISDEVLREIGGGIYNNKGILKGKYCFYIQNSKSQIVGLAGRDVSGNNGNFKWILRGQKGIWCFPASINSNIIREKQSVWLLESIGDLLSFYEVGIKNCLVLFGTDLNLSIINYLLKIDIKSIYISTNDDSNQDNNMAGNKAAEKIYKRLNKYFSGSQIKIVHPKGEKDWNEILIKENGKQLILEQLKEYIN